MIELAQFNYEQGHYAEAQMKLDQFLAISAPTQQSQALGEKLGTKMGTHTP